MKGLKRGNFIVSASLHCSSDFSANKPSLHNHGFLGTHNTVYIKDAFKGLTGDRNE